MTKIAMAIKISTVTVVTILSPQVDRLTALIFFPYRATKSWRGLLFGFYEPLKHLRQLWATSAASIAHIAGLLLRTVGAEFV